MNMPSDLRGPQRGPMGTDGRRNWGPGGPTNSGTPVPALARTEEKKKETSGFRSGNSALPFLNKPLPGPSEAPVPCAGHTALWFSRDKAEIRAAQAICQTCPHRWPCLTGAIERDEKFGVWGGHDFAGLSPAALRQRRHRGRAS